MYLGVARFDVIYVGLPIQGLQQDSAERNLYFSRSLFPARTFPACKLLSPSGRSFPQLTSHNPKRLLRVCSTKFRAGARGKKLPDTAETILYKQLRLYVPATACPRGSSAINISIGRIRPQDPPQLSLREQRKTCCLRRLPTVVRSKNACQTG
jgi:hypothetical protein